MTEEERSREIERLEDAWHSEVTKYDRTVLSLATGVLALSATLVRDQADELEWTLLLFLGWLSLLASIGFIVWSSAISKRAIESRLLDEDGSKIKESNKLGRDAWSRSIWSGWALFAGSSLLIVFTWLNVT